MVKQQPAQEMQVGDGMYVMMLPIADLHEQDVNAQVVSPRHMERLAENIRIRGQVESLPYVYWPHREGVPEIISGHHRVRAARAAGLTEVPCLVDVIPMRRSQVTAKVIAHNELHGTPDANILAQMVASIDNVDDLLMTGLPEDQLPTPDDDNSPLGLPHAEFDWRLVTLLFLPHQLAQLESALDAIDKHSELVGVAPREEFEEFSRQVIDYGRSLNIRSVATSVSAIIAIARREVELAQADGVRPDSTWIRTADLVGAAMPPDAADVVKEAVGKMRSAGDVPDDQPWRALEYMAASYLAGA